MANLLLFLMRASSSGGHFSKHEEYLFYADIICVPKAKDSIDKIHHGDDDKADTQFVSLQFASSYQSKLKLFCQEGRQFILMYANLFHGYHGHVR